MVVRTLENLENLEISWDEKNDMENLGNLEISWDFFILPSHFYFQDIFTIFKIFSLHEQVIIWLS